MNLSMIRSSIKYIKCFKLITSLSLCINNLITKDLFTDSKFVLAITKYDSEVASMLYVYIQDNRTKCIVVTNICIDLCKNKNVSEANIKIKPIHDIFTSLIMDNINLYVTDEKLHHVLCYYGFFDIIKILVENGSLLYLDKELLDVACLFKHYELAKYLFEKGNHKNDSVNLSYVSKDYETVKFFLDRNVRHDIDEAFLCACENNDAAIAELFLDHGADVHGGAFCSPEEPLQIAIENKNKALIKLLRKHGASKIKAVTLNWIQKGIYHIFKDIEIK